MRFRWFPGIRVVPSHRGWEKGGGVFYGLRWRKWTVDGGCRVVLAVESGKKGSFGRLPASTRPRTCCRTRLDEAPQADRGLGMLCR